MSITTKFYGTRGSIPVCEPNFQKFGGNTTCFGFIHGGRMDIIDAGTGIRAAGRDILAQEDLQYRISIAFTHFHWDHIQGLPFFEPAYSPDHSISLIALGKSDKTERLEKVIKRQMGEDYFPIELEKMGARFNFLMIAKEDFASFYDIGIKTQQLNHPGGCFGYRIDTGERVVVVCTDVEHGETIDQRVVDFAKGADLLIHDAQYTDEELETHRGWGHTSYSQAIEVAEQAGVGQLAMTHHDPDHDDEFLEKIEKTCQDRFKDCFLARDGMEIVL